MRTMVDITRRVVAVAESFLGFEADPWLVHAVDYCSDIVLPLAVDDPHACLSAPFVANIDGNDVVVLADFGFGEDHSFDARLAAMHYAKKHAPTLWCNWAALVPDEALAVRVAELANLGSPGRMLRERKCNLYKRARSDLIAAVTPQSLVLLEAVETALAAR